MTPSEHDATIRYASMMRCSCDWPIPLKVSIGKPKCSKCGLIIPYRPSPWKGFDRYEIGALTKPLGDRK